MVGDATQAQTMQNAGFMSEWQASPYDIPEFSSGEAIEKGKIFLVDNPGSVQSVVSIFKPAPTFDAFDEHFKLNLANFPLGGMFNSRINLNLREDKGYTYGASSRFVGGKNLGYFVAGADVTAEHTKASIDEFLSEIESYKANGMSADELAFLQNAYSQSDALNYETPRQKAGFLIRLLSLDLEKDYGKKQQEIIQNITTDELNQLASKWLDTSTMHIVVVGDAKSLQTQLAELNRDIVLFDVPR
jgi:zinc protease